MTKHRDGVFETNSSSVHSICLAYTTEHTKIPSDSQLSFKLDYFGWELNTLTTPEEKASYFWTAVVYLFSDEVRETIKNRVRGVLQLDNISCEFQEPVYNERLREPNERAPLSHDYGIDHIFDTDLLYWIYHMLSSPHDFKNFLFSPDSFILTGNDNDGEWIGEDDPLPVDYPCSIFTKGN